MEAKKTKIGIGLFKNPNGRKEIKAKVWKMQTNTKGIFTFEEKFIELKNNLKKQINITDKKSGNALEHWKLGNMLIEFYDYAEKEGFDFRENTKPLVDYIGKTESFWMLHKKFRRTYTSKEMINSKIPWKMYLYLMRAESDDARKMLEEMILDGKIGNNQGQLRKYIHFTVEQLKQVKKGVDAPQKKKFSIAQQKVYDALKRKDMTKEELVKSTGNSWDGIRGRMSELRNQFDCNIYIVGDRYHLDEKNRANKVARKSHTSKNPA